jgi:hypothetical protein
VELWPGGPLVLPHEFWVDEHRLVLPETKPATLLGWLAGGAWWELIPLSLDPNQALPLNLRFHDPDDDYDYEHWWEIATTLLGRLSGLSTLDGSTDGYWPARRLASTALHDWPFYAAWCAEHGRAPLRGQLYEIMGQIYGWMRFRAGPGGVEKLDAQVFAPPPYKPVAANEAVPRQIRDQEAALALAALREQLPGDAETFAPEWTPSAAS